MTALLTDYLSIGFNQGEAPEKFRKLYVSRASTPRWLTIPWDVDYHDPADMHWNPNGWTVLRGPASYVLATHARVKGLQPGCSTHIQGVRARSVDGLNTIVGVDEAPERFVGTYESSHTHIDGTFAGVLAAGELLQFRIDYWNAVPADAYGLLTGASVRGFWGPLPDTMVGKD